MGRLVVSWISSALICWPMAAAAEPPSPAEASLNKLADEHSLASVVRIHSSHGDGAGFIIGRHGDTLWVATAWHVVGDPVGDDLLDSNPVSYPDLTVSLYGRAQLWSLTGPAQFAGDDLAFVPVRVPWAQNPYDAWQQRILENEPRAGDPVFLGSYPDHIGRKATGQVIPEDMKNLPFAIEGDKGQSGSPVLAGRGIIGLYLGSGPAGFVPIGTIMDRAGNNPVLAGGVQVQYYPPRPFAIKACLAVKGAEPHELSLTDGNGPHRLDKTGCANVESGNVRVISAALTYDCSPSLLHLDPGQSTPIKVNCARSPVGIWRDASVGGLVISRDDESHWSFTGLESSPLGQVSGKIAASGGVLMLEGQTMFGAVVNGNLVFDGPKLRGRIVGPYGNLDVDLERGE